jgi:outer membrane receptor protein involved in Fe transport
MGALRNSFDTSGVQTINLKADLTFQANKYNQLKIGFEYNYDELTTIYGEWNGSWDDSINRYVSGTGGLEFEKSSNWKHYPIRAGAYIQDKIEYEGVIANIGIRMDYSNPNSEWYTVDRYSQWFKPRYMFEFEEKAPTEPAKSHLKLSPRFGISHPISEASKLYFNYGWFYGMPESEHLYRLEYGVLNENEGVQWIGNPSLDPARTIAYELGYEHNLFNQYLIHIAGYYKDITNQTGSVRYTGYMGLVNYRTYENKNYADIRGFEFSVRKRFGRWIKGWFNYDYRVQTSGYIGRNQYFQDVREQRIYGWQNPYQEKPLARPVLRAMITLMTPKNWGPTIGNINPVGGFDLTLVYSQKAGSYFTWDPLETYELVDNLQWETYSNWDLRLEKVVNIAGAQIDLFMDIHNIFDKKHLHHSLGFEDSNDRESYLSSLHLPMYDDEKYIEQGFTPGNDKPGDIKSDDKPYIDMPNKELFTFFDPRYISLGLRIEF